MTHREEFREETARQSAEARDIEVGLPPADCVDALRADVSVLFETIRGLIWRLQEVDVVEDSVDLPYELRDLEE